MVEAIRAKNNGEDIDFILPGFLAKPLASFHSMREDLRLCQSAVDKLMSSNDDGVVKASLWHTIIILYGKCFTDASSSGMSRLVANQCFSEGQQDLRQTHDKLMELRNNFVAHRGSTDNEFFLVYLTLNHISLERQVQIKSVKRLMPDHNELIEYKNLITHLISVVEGKFERAANKVWKNMLDNFSPEELSQLKIAGPVKP